MKCMFNMQSDLSNPLCIKIKFRKPALTIGQV